MRFSLILYILFLSAAKLIAQNQQENNFDIFPVEQFDYMNSSFPNEFFYQTERLRQNPINLNTASSTELLRIPWLTHADADAIISYRERNSRFFSKTELYLIKELDTAKTALVLSYLTLSNSGETPIKNESKNIVNLDHPEFEFSLKNIYRDKTTDNSSIYRNTKLNLYSQVSSIYSFGFSAIRSSSNKSKDALSYFIEFPSIPNVENLIIGDYRIAFGHGLVFGSYIPMQGFLNQRIAFQNHNTTLTANEQLSSSLSLRGAAALINISKSVSLMPFASSKLAECSIDSSGDITPYTYFLSSPFDDLNYNLNNSVTENSIGLMINTSVSKELSIYGLCDYVVYNKQIDFGNISSKSVSNFSISGILKFPAWGISAEVARVNNVSPYLIYLNFNPSSNFEFSYSLHNYPAYSKNTYSNRFSLTGNQSSETGSLASIRTSAFDISIIFIFQQFQYSPVKYNLSRLNGNSYCISADKKFSNRYSNSLLFKYSSTEKAVSTIGYLKNTEKQLNINYRISFAYDAYLSIHLISQFKHSETSSANTSNAFSNSLAFKTRFSKSLEWNIIFSPYSVSKYSSPLNLLEFNAADNAQIESYSGDGNMFSTNVKYRTGKTQFAIIYSSRFSASMTAYTSRNFELFASHSF